MSTIQASPDSLPYWRRGLCVFILAVIAGPFIAWLGLIGYETFSTWRSQGLIVLPSRPFELLATTYVLGAPFTLIAAFVVARQVAWKGNISYWAAVTIALLTPLAVLGMVGGGIGLFFGLFYGAFAAFSAACVQFAGTFFARRVLGVPV